MRGPAQIANRIRGQFLVRGAGPLGDNPQQFPEYRVASQLLSANVAACVTSNNGSSNAPQWICLSVNPLSVTRAAFDAVAFAQLRCLSMSAVIDAAESIGTNTTNPVFVGDATVGAGPAGTGVTPLDLWSGRFSNAKVRVRFSDGTGQGRSFICDVGGGWTISYCASHVGVDLLLPDDSVIAAPNASGTDVAPLAGATGTVEDFVIESAMTLTEGSGLTTGNPATLTISRAIGANDEAIFKIPAGVDSVSVSSTVDTVNLRWLSFIDAAGNVAEVGRYPAASLDGGAYAVPRTARHLFVGNPEATGQTVTVIWTLET